jgi:hypothetical protein
MKISETTVKRLGEIITGDKGISPYRGRARARMSAGDLGRAGFDVRQACVYSEVADPRAHRMTQYLAGVIRLQHFGDRRHNGTNGFGEVAWRQTVVTSL